VKKNIAKKISKFTKREIDYLFQHARRFIKTKECVILLAPRQQDFGRVLIVASRKVGNAPERNLIRRRIKSIFYEEQLFEHLFDCAVITYKPMVDLPFDQLKNLILDAYRKALQSNEKQIS
jgi:ribonuclease P protein component